METAINNIMEEHGNIQLSEFKIILIEDLDDMINEVIETFQAIEIEKDKTP